MCKSRPHLLLIPPVNIPFIQQSSVTHWEYTISFTGNFVDWILGRFLKMKHLDHRIKQPQLNFNSTFISEGLQNIIQENALNNEKDCESYQQNNKKE